MNFKTKLASGEPLLGTFLKTPSLMICEVLCHTDMDVVCIDAEHAPFDRAEIDQCMFAFNAANIPCVVRVPAMSAEHILNSLDCGADGILAPHVISGKDAEFLVNKSQYGKGRGFAGSTRAAHYTAKKMPQHMTESNAQATVLAQIEDVEALENLDSLFAVDGIDCFFIGRNDLTVSMGLDNPNDPAVVAAVEDICKRGQAAGKCIGMFTGNLDEVAHWRNLGVSLFLLGSDHSFMLSGAKQLSEKVRGQF